ncbi:MATE family efflux transporter [Enterocloster bolteae]|uniref:MATE family efflux transporter n=1 Tax=Enterocloster bolteae TaxID=208479 RepID=UPI0028DD0499|nr:MATE family efflux transporter [Enterocloster bolteae]
MFSNKDLKKLITPLIVEQILLMMVGIADTIMISYAGEAEISGVALVDMVNYLIITVLSAVATGGAVVVSQYIGRKEPENANRTAGQLFSIAFLISMGITVLCLLFFRQILSGLFGGVEADVMRAAQCYLLITACSFPFLGIYNSSSALFRSMNKTKVIMYVSLLMNVINVIGNAIGIFVFHAGVLGVAVPTLLSRAIAAIIMLVLSMQRRYEIYVTWKSLLSWNKKTAMAILKIAVPNGIENGLFALGRVLVTSIVALFGTTQIAANGVAGSIDQIASIATNAMNLAIIPVVGQCIGAGEYDQASYYTRKLMRITYLLIGSMGGLVIITLPVILGFYELSAETRQLCIVLIIMHNVMAFLLHPTSFVLSNSLRAAGDVKVTMYIGVASMIIFRLGTAVLFGIVFGMGVVGVWVAMGMDWLARSIAFSIRYKGGQWRHVKVI